MITTNTLGTTIDTMVTMPIGTIVYTGGGSSAATYVGTHTTGAGGTGSSNIYSNATMIGSNGTYNSQYVKSSPSSVVTFYNNSHNEVVRVNPDGSVTWANGVNVDEAAESFATALTLGAERAAGISYFVKQKMRDTVFEELISIAKEKGSLSSEDLTYFWQVAKIVDKLKGVRDF